MIITRGSTARGIPPCAGSVNVLSASPAEPKIFASGSARGDLPRQRDRVAVGDRADQHAVGAAGCDGRAERAIVRCLRVEALRADDVDRGALGGEREARRAVVAVDLAVVEHVRLRAALALLQLDLSDRLHRVAGHDPGVRADAGRVVLLRLAGRRAGAARGEPDGGARRADLRDPEPVQDRDRDRAGARVELADVADRGRVRDRQLAR